MSLKQKTINGLFWSFIDSFANQGVQFIVGIILARILSPREFGLIGMLTIFIAISQSFVDSGFSNALIRKKDCTQEDYSTVFYFNLLVGILLYLILFFSASPISSFFKEPQLTLLLKILGLGVVFNAFGLIHRTILTKEINFKLQTRVSLVASIGSGSIAVTMALLGYGVWSLVVLTLARFGLNTLFFWIWAKWKPLHVFSKKSFNELFAFGSKLLLSGLIDTIYRNVYYLIIGKYFSAKELGFYTRADQFKAFPSQNLNNIIRRVSYPVLSSIQEDTDKLKQAYQKIIRTTMFVTFCLMLGMAAVAKPMIVTLIGEKWLPSVIYLQMLCFVGMFYPLHALNLNMLQVQGRSDLFLKLEIIKKVLAVPTIIIGIFWGIKLMILGMFINTIFEYYLNSLWSGKLLNYSFKNQVKDIMPAFSTALIMAIIVYSLGVLIDRPPILLLLFQIITGAVLIVFFGELTQLKDYIFLKSLVLEKITILKRNEKVK
ncbi:MOP flippase family protein [Sunxiuqinia elliptica]|uniref:O-antigen/teichoic acid export membrane protein n=1 Tax=Sunxiuqinia elliptica TaxID=655355 RepID=A0A4R6GSH2_9BACT|nr:MOP flippase family protein [Sunxiuqinia elliptica]TDN98216.1 O-antigen/teichoic acid export membrane protein [Sunxiuqinia elliptica]TDO60323.1 O-antigen/teichoic acid export membrane protein [Sunxiuqinia elliptica]